MLPDRKNASKPYPSQGRKEAKSIVLSQMIFRPVKLASRPNVVATSETIKSPQPYIAFEMTNAATRQAETVKIGVNRSGKKANASATAISTKKFALPDAIPNTMKTPAQMTSLLKARNFIELIANMRPRPQARAVAFLCGNTPVVAVKPKMFGRLSSASIKCGTISKSKKEALTHIFNDKYKSRRKRSSVRCQLNITPERKFTNISVP